MPSSGKFCDCFKEHDMLCSALFSARTSPLIISLGIALALSPSVRAQGASDDAVQLATSILTAGARTFDTKNAAAMAATYTEDAEIHLTSREEGGAIKVQVSKGKEEIRKFYEDLFKDAKEIKSKNTVEFARLIRPDVLVIYGNFRPDADADPLPFVQVRTRQGETWLMRRLQLFVLGE
jgi:hypothetical protein